MGITAQEDTEEEEDESFVPQATSKPDSPTQPPQQTPSEMARDLMLHADIPLYDDLINSRPAHLKCLHESQKYSSKTKREVNYFTSQMQKIVGKEDVDLSEVVLRIAFYHQQKPVKTQEFLVLGSQCLVELKDVFYCLIDKAFEDVTSSSGYFFIENVFYNDTRAPDSFEYSTYVNF